MRVLKIIHTHGHGGAENTFRWLAWGLQRQGVEVIAAIPRARDPKRENWIAPALEELGISYVTFDKSGSPWQLFKNLSEIIKQVQPDIVHSHLLDSNFYAALACSKNSIPHICTEHGDIFLSSSSRTRLKYMAISRLSSLVVCVSEAVRGGAARRIAKSKLKTIYNGIRFIIPGVSTFRQEFGIPESAVCIGAVGNLYPVKGHTYLITAFSRLLSRQPETRLVLVGRGSEEKMLRDQVASLNIPEDRVIFTGFRGDIENILNSLDVYVQPSLSEGHPLAVLEAMSLGLPVIASRVGGLPELFCDETFGTLVPPGSSDDLHEKLLEYVDQPDRFQHKATLARDHVLKAYSIEEMAGNYIACYRQAMA
ncbi:glycosyltransferase [Pelotalea chapellei]|uniref:Glycosyltransferase n=1 Tax=Pelotalea chapellei TaxID=44671 RepID=A0ABS5U838_9BACT|nr:glycosyltransferase [Pelotalea chapellei]MBT1071831.1 glycosyltransferase [Pelotalea chapellei]